jgi:microcystin degradation protein MlrC
MHWAILKGKVDFLYETSHIITLEASKEKDERRVEVVSNHDHPHLVDVAELGVSVTEILDLSCGSIGQTVIALAHVALSVLPLAVEDTEGGQEEDADLAAQVDGVAGRVSRCVVLSVGPGYKLATVYECDALRRLTM